MRTLLILTTLWVFLFVEVASPSQMIKVMGQAKEDFILPDQPYSLVNWNIYKANKPGFHQDFHWLLSHNDLFTLQEFYLNGKQQSQVTDWIDLSWVFAKSFYDSSAWTGVVTLSPWKSDILALKSQDREPLIGTPKVSLITKYQVHRGGELWVLNIHALNFDITHKSFQRQLDDLFDEVLEYHGPLILAGDFNTWSQWRRNYLIRQTRKLGLLRAPLESPSGIFNNTLDHIFYRGIRALEFNILEMSTSDHKPLQMIFTIEDAAV